MICLRCLMANNIKNKWRLIAIIVMNLVVVIVTILCVLSFFTEGKQGNMDAVGAVAFRYFTVDSNILAAISSAVIILYAFRELVSSKVAPYGIRIFRLSSVTSTTLTFLTVMLFLGPFVYGYPLLFEGASLYMHLVTPLIVMFSFIRPESVGAVRIKKLHMLFGTVPMFLYGMVYITMVVITEKWPDFYAFNRGGYFWLTAIIMISFTAGIAYALGLSADAVAKKTNRKENQN